MHLDHNAWNNIPDPSFLEMCSKSGVPEKWILFKNISDYHKNSIVKPINKYVEYLYPPPELLSINQEEIILRQKTHADIYLRVNDDGSFYSVDKPWVRQYYRSKLTSFCSDCFPEVFKAYVPWIMDIDTDIVFEGIDGSPFSIMKTITNFAKTNNDLFAIEPIMVAFSFKKHGAHMIEKDWGIIRARTPIFDIKIRSNAIIEEKTRNFYANYQVSPIQRTNH